MTNPFRENEPPPIIKWEYTTFRVLSDEMEVTLNLYGSKGWEMIDQNWCSKPGVYRIWMKRQIP